MQGGQRGGRVQESVCAQKKHERACVRVRQRERAGGIMIEFARERERDREVESMQEGERGRKAKKRVCVRARRRERACEKGGNR